MNFCAGISSFPSQSRAGCWGSVNIWGLPSPYGLGSLGNPLFSHHGVSACLPPRKELASVAPFVVCEELEL